MDSDAEITFEQGHAWFVPVEGTLSPAALAQPANWMPYAIDLGPCLAGPISFGPGDETSDD